MPPKRVNTMPEHYDQALHYARDQRLPPGCPQPQPTKAWPRENVDLLERYAGWLRSGGASENVIRTIYIPMAGHVLGLALKPHPLLDLETDLQPALDYVQAKGVGPDWSDVCRNSLLKFRRFLLHERGQIEIKYKPYDDPTHRRSAGLAGGRAQPLPAPPAVQLATRPPEREHHALLERASESVALLV